MATIGSFSYGFDEDKQLDPYTATGAQGSMVGSQAGGNAGAAQNNLSASPAPMQAPPGGAGVSQPPPMAPSYGTLRGMQGLANNPGGTPQQQALSQDALARQLAKTLQDAGHQVKWQGDQLIVDGRAYTIGGAMAAGGIVTEPTVALIGEQGPEAVTPLSQPTVSPVIQQAATQPAPMTTSTVSPLMSGTQTATAPTGAGVASPLPTAAPTAAPTQYPVESGPVPQQSGSGTAGTFTGPNVQYAEIIKQWYRTYLGREASDQEVQARLNDKNFDPNRQAESIMFSEEAEAYRTRTGTLPGQDPATGTPQTTTTTTQQGDTSQWDTDGYAKPAYTVAGKPTALAGWDQQKWSDVNHQTPKYVIGRILSQYPATTANMAKVVAEIAKAYPGTTQVSNGDIKVPGLGVIDILIGADVGGKGWHWGTGDGGGAASGGGGYTGQNFAPVGGAPGGGGGGYSVPGFQMTAPTYQPGEIGMDDIPGASFEQLLALAQQGNTLDPEIEASIKRLLENPSGMSEQAVGEMKAKSKDELSEMAKMESEDSRDMAYQYGIAQSPWYASEQLSQRRGRDKAAVESYRDIDIAAANKRKEDERLAVSQAEQWASSKAARQQAAVFGAHGQALQAASLRSDRMQLREQTKQMATQLGISSDQVRLSYIQSLIQDATQRYGIDIGAQIDWARLTQAGQIAQENFIFQYAQLAQNDQQFGASYGLSVAQLNELIRVNNWEMSKPD